MVAHHTAVPYTNSASVDRRNDNHMLKLYVGTKVT